MESFDIDVITSVMKQYLQALPEPILTNVLFPRFITVSTLSDSPLQLEYLGSLINSLPANHLDLLRFLIEFLLKVIEHQEQNKMTLQNISIIFGPILMQMNTEDISPDDMLTQANCLASIVKLLLTHHETIFKEKGHSIHTVKALNPYTPKKGQDGALEVQEGSIIHVFRKENTMWYGEIEGRVGFFPRSDITRSSKVIIIKDVSIKIIFIHKQLNLHLSSHRSVSAIPWPSLKILSSKALETPSPTE